MRKQATRAAEQGGVKSVSSAEANQITLRV